MTTRELRSYLMTTRDICQAMDLKPGTLHQWRNRGFLTMHGTQRNALWDVRELADIITAKRGERRRVA